MLAKLRLLNAVIHVLRNPSETERIFAMADELTDETVIDEMIALLSQHPRSAAALEDIPSLGEIDMDALAAMPEGSLGRSFFVFLDENGLDPTLLTDQAKNEKFNVIRHLAESHDLWHVLTGMAPNEIGELGLQAFYLAQVPSKLNTLLIGLGLLRAVVVAPEQNAALMASITRGWQMGRDAEPLWGMPWAAMWETPLVEIQQELNLTVAA